MNGLTYKLTKDGSSRVQTKINLVSLSIGLGLLSIGAICAFAKMFLDANVLFDTWTKEKLLLLSLSAVFALCGTMVSAVTGIGNTIQMFKSQCKAVKFDCMCIIIVCADVLLFGTGILVLLLNVNTWLSMAVVCMAYTVTALVLAVNAMVLKRKMKSTDQT